MSQSKLFIETCQNCINKGNIFNIEVCSDRDDKL